MLNAEDLKVGKTYRFYESINGERARHYKIGRVLKKYRTYILFEVLPDLKTEKVLGIPKPYNETYLNCEIGLCEHPVVFENI